MARCELKYLLLSALLLGGISALADKPTKGLYCVYIEKVQYKHYDNNSLGCTDGLHHSTWIDVTATNFNSLVSYKSEQLNGTDNTYIDMGNKLPMLARLYMEIGTFSYRSTDYTNAMPISTSKITLEKHIWKWDSWGICCRDLEVSYKVVVDGPVNVKLVSNDKGLSAESSTITLKISDFYENGKGMPELQVSVDEFTWRKVTSVYSGQTVSLRYSQIVPSDKFDDWLGKNLQFRVVKKLLNGVDTYDEIEEVRPFYPMGIKFDVHSVSSRSCDDNIDLVVTLKSSSNHHRYVIIDSTDIGSLYWVVAKKLGQGRKGPLLRCKMKHIEGSNKYNLTVVVPEEVPPRQSPFFHDFQEGTAAEWYIQLIEKNNLDNITSIDSFTVLPKPPAIHVKQNSKRYTVNGKEYTLPHRGNIYALLDIREDTSQHYAPHFRLPYTVKDDKSKKIDDIYDVLASSYKDLLPSQRQGLDKEFEREYNNLNLQTEQNKFISEYACREIAPAGSVALAKDGSYFLHTVYGTGGGVFKTTLVEGRETTTQRLVSNFWAAGVYLLPNSHSFVYHERADEGLSYVEMDDNGQVIREVLLASIGSSYTVRGVIYNPARGCYEVIGQGAPNNLYGIAIPSGEKRNIMPYTYDDFIVSESGYVFYSWVVGSEVHVFSKNLLTNDSPVVIDRTTRVTTVINNGQGSNSWTDRVYCDGSWEVQKESKNNYQATITINPVVWQTNAKWNYIVVNHEYTEVYRQEYLMYCRSPYYCDGCYDCENCTRCNPCTESVSSGTQRGNTVKKIGINNASSQEIMRDRIFNYYSNGVDYAYSPYSSTGIYANINGRNAQLSTRTASQFFIPETNGFFLFKDRVDNKIYRQFTDTAAMLQAFKEDYKKRWLADNLGTKLYGVKLDTVYHLSLYDVQGCLQDTFTVKITAPDTPRVIVSILKYPNSPCSNEGRIHVTYLDGGVPPYKYGNRILEGQPYRDTLTIGGLSYYQNYIQFSDGAGNPSYRLTINWGAIGITDVSVKAQTCRPPNGQITVSTARVSGQKIFYLKTSGYVLVDSMVSNQVNHTFTNLPAGNYMVSVKSSDGCMLSDDKIHKVHDSVFSIENITTTPSATIDGKGNLSVKFANRQSGAAWSLRNEDTWDITSDVVTRSNLAPKAYTLTATSGGCTLPDTVVHIGKPSCEGNLFIDCAGDSCVVSSGNLSSNWLFDNTYQLVIKSGDNAVSSGNLDPRQQFKPIIKGGSESNTALLYKQGTPYQRVVIHREGYYNISAYSANEEVVLHKFLPFDTIEVAASTSAPACPDSLGKVELSIGDGVFNNRDKVEVSLDMQHYSKGRTFSLSPSRYNIMLRDSKTESTDKLPLNFTYTYTQPLDIVVPNAERVRANISRSDPLCSGAEDGRLWLSSVAGGSGEYTYWANGLPHQDTSRVTEGLRFGEYRVYLKDTLNNCPAEDLGLARLYDPTPLRIDMQLVRQPTCELPNGRLEAQVSGGANLSYQVRWFKNNALYRADSFQVDPALLLLNEPEQPYTPPLFLLDTLDTLEHGLYRLEVTDYNKCTVEHSVRLRQYFNPKVDSATVSPVSCHRYADGTIAVYPNDTTTSAVDSAVLQHLDLPFRRSMQTPFTFNELDTGSYELYVYDTLGCRSNLSYAVKIKEPPVLHIRVDSVYPVAAKGTASGSIAFTVQGGNDSVKPISLQNADNQSVAKFSNRSDVPLSFSGVSAGSYSIYAVDRKGCSDTTALLRVAEPAEKLGFTVTEKKDALCKAQTGSITVEAYGGWGGYGYRRAANAAYSAQGSFERLFAGSYIISVQDRLGAVFSDTIVVYEPKDSLMAHVQSFTLPTCGSNGTAQIAVSGGSAPYQLFAGSDTSYLTSSAQSILRSGLSSGAHLFTLTDNNGCRFELEAHLPNTEALRITGFDITHPSAAGAANGAIEVLTAGGSAPYSYAFSHNGSVISTGSARTKNLVAGLYSVEVSEGSGCSVAEQIYLPNATDASFKVVQLGHETSFEAADGYAMLQSGVGALKSVTLFSPQGSKAEYAAADVRCRANLDPASPADTICLGNLSGGEWFVEGENEQGEKVVGKFEVSAYRFFKLAGVQLSHVSKPGQATGSIRVELEGGGGGNVFTWKNTEGEALASADDEQATTLRNLPAGEYTLMVTDRYGNALQQAFEVQAPAQALTIAVGEHRNESCYSYEDAFVRLTAAGGWGDYQFRHDTEKHFSNLPRYGYLPVRSHRFYLTDLHGELDSLDVSITEPDQLRSSVSAVDSTKCKDAYDGSITFALAGGAAPYYLRERDVAPAWTDGVVAGGLREGYHTFVFTDSNGCACADTLQVYVPQPDSLLPARIAVQHTLCGMDNGAMQVAMQGGTRPYRYAWTDFYDRPVGADSVVGGLQRDGLYTLRITDRHSCAYTIEQRISSSTLPQVKAVNTTPVLCYGDTTGIARIAAVTPATPFAPYSFTWSNGDTGTVTNRYSYGTHHVTITDTNGCATTYYFDVAQPDSLRTVLVDSKQPHCYGYADGWLNVAPMGGVGGYRYLWATGDTLPLLDSIPAGAYAITLTDNNGCTFHRVYSMGQPDMLPVDVGHDITICPGNSYTLDGQNYAAHRWYTDSADLAQGRFFTVNEEGTYYLKATDNRGCHAYDTISVKVGSSALQADFLLSSGAMLGDTLILFELSNMPLDSLRWQYSAEDFVDISGDEHRQMEYVLLLLPQSVGEYTIGLYAYAGGCFSYVSKEIAIRQSEFAEPAVNMLGYREPLIQSFKAFPNPSSGEFSVEVQLREPADIRLNLFSLNSSSRLDDRHVSGLAAYHVSYSVSGIPSGVYILLLTAGGEHQQVKIIKK